MVSVLMTSYNREEFIAEAIESVLASTFKNFELIILDDASSDNTLAIAKKYETIDSRIKVVANEKNLSQFPNRNKAAKIAKGKYIKYVDSDDLIYDWGLEYCVELMEKHSSAGMAIFQNKNKIDVDILEPEQAVRFHFFNQAFLNIGPSGTIVRREAFEKTGGYNAAYGVPSDMYFNLKMAANYPIALLKKTFFHYRVHDGQEIHNTYSYLYNNYPYLRDVMLLPEMPLSPDEKKRILKRGQDQFFRHAVRYGFKTFELRKVYKAFLHSEMSVKELLQAPFRKEKS